MKPSISIGMRPPSYGGGYGISQNTFWDERPVASGPYGIYPEQGEWDKDDKKGKEDEEGEEGEDDINKLTINIANKMCTSAIQIPNDTHPKPDHKSFGNLGSHNLVSHAEKNGNLLKEYIKEVLSETGISGRGYTKRSLGDPYKVDNTTVGAGISRSAAPKSRSVQSGPNSNLVYRSGSGVGPTIKFNDYLEFIYGDKFDDKNDDEFDEKNVSSATSFSNYNPDEENLKKHNK